MIVEVLIAVDQGPIPGLDPDLGLVPVQIHDQPLDHFPDQDRGLSVGLHPGPGLLDQPLSQDQGPYRLL